MHYISFFSLYYIFGDKERNEGLSITTHTHTHTITSSYILLLYRTVVVIITMMNGHITDEVKKKNKGKSF